MLARLVGLGNKLAASTPRDDPAGSLHALIAFGRLLLAEGARVPDHAALVRFLAEVAPHVDSRMRDLRRDALAVVDRATPDQRAGIRRVAGALDLLGPLSDARDEVTHSRVVANILAPSRSPDLGLLPLRALFMCIPALKDALVDDLTVEAEPWIDVRRSGSMDRRRRPDILVTTRSHLVLIEMKVDSDEQPHQLRDYRKWMQMTTRRDGREGVLVYLTPPEHAGSRSLRSGFVHVTFQDLFDAWLPIALSAATDAHVYFQLYLGTIAQHIIHVVQPGAPLEASSVAGMLILAGLLEDSA
ncbi:MAG: PD-(D/E)XK nuclease family protein [Deltaproteobacteria bacterium]|nr:PD-(D/E)XK nuclease family protein [Deltaproteobacteria bacterium]